MDSHILLACKHVRMQIRKFCHVVFHFKSYIKEPSFTCVCYNILIVQFPEYGAAVSKFGLIHGVWGGTLYVRLDIILVKGLSKHTLNTCFSGMKIDPKYVFLHAFFLICTLCPFQSLSK